MMPIQTTTVYLRVMPDALITLQPAPCTHWSCSKRMMEDDIFEKHAQNNLHALVLFTCDRVFSRAARIAIPEVISDMDAQLFAFEQPRTLKRT